jgi:hypothetical protein
MAAVGDSLQSTTGRLGQFRGFRHVESVPTRYNPVTSSAVLEKPHRSPRRWCAFCRCMWGTPQARCRGSSGSEAPWSRPTGGRGHSSEDQGVIVVCASITPAASFNAAVSACRPSALTCNT